jgi:molybdopterin molybdotransferase
MTGAPLPAGADAVVMVEHTSLADQPAGSPAGQSVEVRRSVGAGENFVPRGAEARAGQLLVDRGRRLDHVGIAIAASVGKSRVQVFRKPRVAVLSTGDEVVEIDATPGPAQIRNSNSYSLAAQVQNAGGEAVRLAIAPDERGRLRALIEEGLDCDLLLLTGGVSMGKYDLVEQVLGELKAEFYFTGAEIQPGRPVVFGSCGADTPVRVLAANPPSARTGVSAPHKKYFFGLPGNPVSTMVTFELFARPMIEALSGMTPQRLIFLRGRLKSEIRTKTGLKRFLPAVLSGEFENAEVELARWQGSGDIATLARANCYVVIPPERERIEAGEWVSLLMRSC